MNISREWLSEFVDFTAGDRDYAEDMTISGSKVELTHRASEEIKNVVVARIAEILPHPSSEKLVICMMDVGVKERLQIVTGAPNLKVDDYVPLALHDSCLPGGVQIMTSSFKGVDSQGMLCSLKELGLAINDFPYADENGILVLSDDPELKGVLKAGEGALPVLGLDDAVVEFEITSNRPDCLSVIGMARETAATYKKPLKLHEPVVAAGGGDISEVLEVEIKDLELCPRYTAMVVENVKIAPSPLWMRRRLRAAGVRAINNIVDITNYVMLEYGQPMHAFDYRYVTDGKIVVRRAEKGEKLTTLDSNERTLTDSTLVIADTTKAVGIAGIMGGENSEIVEDTSCVVFESANFNGTSIRRSALALGMRTEASAKFEKGLDPENTMPAVLRACELVEMLGAGTVRDGVIDVRAEASEPVTLALRPRKINELLGTDIAASDMADILKSLGFGVEGEKVTVPSWRRDVEHYSDLAEEVARFYGYDKLPATLSSGTAIGFLSDWQKAERDVGIYCRGMGYNEIITYSFIGSSDYDKIGWSADDVRRESLKILNPLGEDRSVMRTSTLPSMMEILARNLNYRNKTARAYEIAKAYHPTQGDLAHEPYVLTMGAYGGTDFFEFKGDLESLFDKLFISDLLYVQTTDNVSYHPGRCAQIYHEDNLIGVFGQVHPTVCENYGVSGELYVCELDFDALLAARDTEILYTPLPRYPAITRDIALICEETVSVGDLTRCIQECSKEYLESVTLFDVYRGKGIAEGKKSVAFSLTLRAEDRTLTDAHAEQCVNEVLEGVQKHLGAVLR